MACVANMSSLTILRSSLRTQESLVASLAKNSYRSFASTSIFREESSGSKAPAPRNAIKDAERALSRAHKMAKMSGVSMVRQDQPLQDIAVLPPLRKIGFGAVKERRKYVWKRLRRGFYTAKSLSDITRRDPYAAKSYDHPYMRYWGMIAGFLHPQTSASGLTSHLSKTWEAWSRAIAGGDQGKLKDYSKAAAYEYAKTRAAAAGSSQAGTKIEWNVVKYLSKPRIVHARNWVVDPKTQAEVAQVIVRFETEQTLTIHQRNKAPSARSSRISECWVFERYLMDPASKWMIRDKVTPFAGGDIPETLI